MSFGALVLFVMLFFECISKEKQVLALFNFMSPSFSPPLKSKQQTKGESAVQSLSKTNCPLLLFLLLHSVLLSSCMLLAVVLGRFRKTSLAPDFWTLGARRHRSQKSELSLSLYFLALSSLAPRQVFVIPRRAKQTCVY